MPVGVASRLPVPEPTSADDDTDTDAATPGEQVEEEEDEDDDAPLATLIARPRSANRGEHGDTPCCTRAEVQMLRPVMLEGYPSPGFSRTLLLSGDCWIKGCARITMRTSGFAVHTRNSARDGGVTPPSTSDSGTVLDEEQPQAAASDSARPEAEEPHMNGELKSHAACTVVLTDFPVVM